MFCSGGVSVDAFSLLANETVESIAIVSSVLIKMVALESALLPDRVSVGLEVVVSDASPEFSFNLSFRMRRLSTNSMCNRRL